MRKLLLVVGLLALAVGLLWIGQGTGVIDWPSSSFMIRQILGPDTARRSPLSVWS